MRWSVVEDDPPLMGQGHEVFLDNDPQSYVLAFDTDEGWVEHFCLLNCTGNGELGFPHHDGTHPTGLHVVREHGDVQLIRAGEPWPIEEG